MYKSLSIGKASVFVMPCFPYVSEGRFQYLCILLRFGNTLRLTHLGAPHSGECTCVGTIP
jgi:hypothetical protein